MRKYEVLQFTYGHIKAESLKEWDLSLMESGFPYDELEGEYKPWPHIAVIQNDIWREWEAVSEAAEGLLANRQTKEIKPYMQRGIVLFLSILFWSNKKPVNLDELNEELQAMAHKPVNVDERISYILHRPNTYPAFMQLKSLMEEQKKMVAKLIALKKL